MYLISPVIILFTLPYLVLSIVGIISPVIVLIYTIYHLLVYRSKPTNFHIGLTITGIIFAIHGLIWHSHEIVNFEYIPDTGPALIVYYHGVIPLDYYYLISKCYVYKRRLIRTIAARFLFKIPLFSLWMSEFLGASHGTVELCTQMLKNGDLVSIAPGGVREAMFSHKYELIWNNRIGFAKIAVAAKVPIIPAFTVNINEAYRTLSFGKNFFRKLFDKTGLPVVPIYGGFPVKLKTILGKPIEFDESLTPEQLATKTAEAIKKLIEEHQRVPGNILKSILDRLPKSLNEKIN